jgi:cytochrome c biogenesis protein CcmG, thiol:disulfide interchange protein DsbE
MRLLKIFFFTLIPLAPAWSQPLNVGSTATDWSLQTGTGEIIEYYQDSDNHVSVILFWATWCPYCATLMPHLEVVYRKYRNKGLKFYAIDILEDGKINPVEYFAKKEYSYTLLLGGDLVADEYGIKGTPALFVIDKDKKIIYKRPAGVSDILVKQNVDLTIKQALGK